MSLDAILRFIGVVSVSWWAIKLIVRLVMGPLPRPQCRCSDRALWHDYDTDRFAEFGIDLTRVADDPRKGGAS